MAAATTSPADGETQTLITVTVTDQFGNPESDKNVTLAGLPSGNVQLHPIAVGGSTPGVTNSAGVAQFEASDSVAETVTITATDSTDSLTLTKTVTITYTAGPADPTAQGSTVTASPANPPADGKTPTTITVTLTDYFSNPVAGTTISLKALNGSSTVAPASGVTNAAGQVAFTATDSDAEVVTYQATDVTDKNTVLPAEAVVTFGNPPAAPPSASFCSVVATPTTVPADGTHTATVTVLLYDANGSPVAGKTVSLTGAAGSSKVAATNATTDDSGAATFNVSDSTAEAVKYTAHDTSDNIDLTATPVTVTFTTAAASSGTTTTTTTTGTTGTTTTTTTSGATPVATSTSSSGGTSGGTTGNTGSAAVSTTPSLASTGAPALLPWLVGLGGLFLIVGTIGRRRFGRINGRESQ